MDSKLKSIYIHFFGGEKELYEKMFPIKSGEIDKKYGKIIKREYQEKNYKIKWIGYKYPELQENNYKEILMQTFNDIKESKDKEIIIIKFGTLYLKEFRITINKFNTEYPFTLFCFSENDNIQNDFFTQIKKKEYVAYIKDKNNPMILIKCIIKLFHIYGKKHVILMNLAIFYVNYHQLIYYIKSQKDLFISKYC